MNHFYPERLAQAQQILIHCYDGIRPSSEGARDENIIFQVTGTLFADWRRTHDDSLFFNPCQ